MEIIIDRKEKILTIRVVGRVDSTNYQEFEEQATKAITSDVTDLTLDFAKLEYISSAGLRVILSISKVMSHQGKMTIVNANDEIKEIFSLTGFDQVLDIE